MGFLLWIEESGLGIFIRESLWGYPIVLSSHAVGMATVMGVVVALNLRVLGFAKEISIEAFDRIFIIGWAGFALNLVSGLILFCGTSTTYFFQGSFQLKLGFILMGGILMKVLMNNVRSETPSPTLKMVSAVCLGLGLLLIFRGLYVSGSFLENSILLRIIFYIVSAAIIAMLVKNVRSETSESKLKIISAVCAACWFGGMITGRLMAYL